MLFILQKGKLRSRGVKRKKLHKVRLKSAQEAGTEVRP